MYFPARTCAPYGCSRPLSYSKRHLRQYNYELRCSSVDWFFLPPLCSTYKPGYATYTCRARKLVSTRQSCRAAAYSCIRTCTVPVLSEFYSPISFYLTNQCVRHSRRTPAGLEKVVTNKIFMQSHSLFLQLWPALFQGWFYFTPLLFRSSSAGCALFQAHIFWGRFMDVGNIFSKGGH